MIELDDGHDDGGDEKMIFKYSNLEKKKEKNKKGSRQRYFLIGPFCFTTQDT